MNSIRKKLTIFTALIICYLGFSIYSNGCADEPSSLGLNFIPTGDTAGVVIFDSYIDSMLITSTNHKKLTNTSGSYNLMVGKNGNYDSKALIQIYNLSDAYDSAVVNSATLTLKYRNYYFPRAQSDSLGQVSFEIFKINESLNLGTITLDSVDNNTFGNISQGSYTGVPASDSEEVIINLNTSMIKDWLESEADTGYANKNYGIVLSPNNSSNVIKAFYSSVNSLGSDVKPELRIIVTKNSDTDTLVYDATGTLSLVNNTTIAQTNELFFLQAGIAYGQVLKFDLSKIPSTATINDVQLYLTIDPVNSILSNQSSNIISSAQVTDTAGLVTENILYKSGTSASNKYTIRLIKSTAVCPFQRWLLGETNYGVFFFPETIQSDLDLYAIYNTTASDPTKRPRLVIKYTPRTTQ